MNRSPVIAGVLSVVLPGLGHLYAGASSRGVALAAAFFAFIQAATNYAGGLAAPALPLLWVFGIVDAVRVTEEMVRARAAGRTPAVGLDDRWAAGLILAGVVATLSLFEDLAWILRLWPLLLVWAGWRMLRGEPIAPDLSGLRNLGRRASGKSEKGDASPAAPPDPPPAAADATPPAPPSKPPPPKTTAPARRTPEAGEQDS